MAKRERVVILLRGVNLGARNKVPMARLRVLVADLGAENVSTFIASGNVLCTPPGSTDDLNRAVEKVIDSEFGVRTIAVARTARQLRAARAAYPYDVHDTRFCAISFLEFAPPADAVTALAAQDFGLDKCQVIGAELHLRYNSGVHNAKITGPKLTRLLGTEGTIRNMRTVDALIDLL